MAVLFTQVTDINVSKLKQELEYLTATGPFTQKILRVTEIVPGNPSASDPDNKTKVTLLTITNTEPNTAQLDAAQQILDTHIDRNFQDEDIDLIGRNDASFGNSELGRILFINNNQTVWKIETNNALLPTSASIFDIGSESSRVGALYSRTVNTSTDALINGATVGLGGSSELTNVAVGKDALKNNVLTIGTLFGQFNTAIGYEALLNNTSGNANVAIGYRSLLTNTTGFSNAALGNGALRSQTTGYSNTAVGNYSLYYNTSGVANTGIGNSALYYNTIGGSNIAIGSSALRNNTTAYYNVAIGSNSLISNTTGTYNVGVGYNTSYYNTTGSYNTIVGHRAGEQFVGGGNTVLGAFALYNPTTTNNSIVPIAKMATTIASTNPICRTIDVPTTVRPTISTTMCSTSHSIMQIATNHQGLIIFPTTTIAVEAIATSIGSATTISARMSQ
jgi:hypothetical protein